MLQRFLLLLFFGPFIFAYAHENLKKPVVLIRNSGAQGEETESGFLVGNRSGSLHALTAFHVIEHGENGRYLNEGTLAPDPQAALARFELAQHQRDTGQIRSLIANRKQVISEEAQRKIDEAAKQNPEVQDRFVSYNDPIIGVMVAVKGGFSELGSSFKFDEMPLHPVRVGSFWIGKNEVTQAQWRSVMGTSPSYFKDCGQCPVERVSWNDIQEFIQKLNAKTGKTYRLPTEAEWEYAAGGGSGSRTTYAGTRSADSLGSFAWYSENSESKTHPVGQKQPNGLGIYDMSGNVLEWCADDWHDNYEGAPFDGRAWVNNPRSANRVNRGGSWNSGPVYYCRVANRFNSNASNRLYYLGFRLARQL